MLRFGNKQWCSMPDQQLVQQVQNTCHLFCAALTKDEVAQFVSYTHVIDLEPQEILADIGDIGNSFYLVIAGSIRLYQVNGDREFEIGEIVPGGLVGEMSFFDRKPRTVCLKASGSGARLLEIQRQMFHRLRIEEPYISTNLLEFVIRSLDLLVRELSSQNASQHVRLNTTEAAA